MLCLPSLPWQFLVMNHISEHCGQAASTPSVANQSGECRLQSSSIRWAFLKWTFLSQPFPPSIYHYVNNVLVQKHSLLSTFLPSWFLCWEMSLPWWCGLCRSKVVRAPELIPATVFVFRTKGKFQQPPLAWYLDDVLECILDKVFLFDRFVLRNFT